MSVSISCDRDVIMQDWNVVNEVLNHIEDPIYYCLAMLINRFWLGCVEAYIQRWCKAFAFGLEDWTRYFGEVGEAPKLPPSIFQTLMSQCLYWEGKRVYETHLLVLIPEEIEKEKNGEKTREAFTLDVLGELIQNPKGGGYQTQYAYYDDDVKRELGNQGNDASYWVLLTKDEIPKSRKNPFEKQVKEYLKKTYTVPKTLDVATAILTHYAKTGKRLSVQESESYIRCFEKIDQDKWRVVVGAFGPLGLRLSSCDDDCCSQDGGLCGSWKF